MLLKILLPIRYAKYGCSIPTRTACKIRTTSGDHEDETLVMWTYDPEKKTYRRWFFFSSGVSFEETGSWNEETKTFEFSGRDEESQRETTSTVKIVDEDTKQWTMKIEAANGNVVEVEGTTRRKK